MVKKEQLEFSFKSNQLPKEKLFKFGKLEITASFWGNGKACIETDRDTWNKLGKFLNKNPLKSFELKSFLRLPKNFKFNEEF